MGTLTARPVNRLAAVPTSAQTLFTPTDIRYDYAIGGLAFLSGATSQHPLVRRTADYRKQQIDVGTAPGEQSLNNWWLRSQSSFHAGTGIVFEEPDQSDATIQYRFADAEGVNVWTQGKVTLLKQANLQVATTGTTMVTAGNDGATDCWLQSDGTVLKRVTVAGISSTVAWGGSGSIVSLSNDGVNYYAADATGIYTGTLAGGAGSLLWNTGSSNVVARWMKQRLVAGIGNKFYELTGTGPALPTEKYAHPNTGWQWTAISESPSAIYAAGYVGTQSAIYKFVLDTSGNVPTLTSGIITASLPNGEYVTALYNYLGDFVAIGTNKGVRIAEVDTNGNLSYGPLTVNFSLMPTTPGPVTSFTGQDRFVYFTLSNGFSDGTSGLGRIDLGTTIAFRKFVWAKDLLTHVSGTARGVATVGTSGQLVVVVDGHGSYLQHASNLEPAGYLQTGNIRFHTLEPKLFKFVYTRAAPMAGTLGVQTFDHLGNSYAVATFSVSGADVTEEASLPVQLGPQEYIALQFNFARDATASKGPELRAYQVKALPATKRQRSFILPLLCFDHEADMFGRSTGYEGSALDRLVALEALEEAGDLVVFQDLTRHPQEVRACVIDDLEFVQVTPPKNASGWGGIVQVTLRAVT